VVQQGAERVLHELLTLLPLLHHLCRQAQHVR
jgi:hypothetical protein